MAIWDEVFDTFGGKAITKAITEAFDGERRKMIDTLVEGAALQELKDTVKDAVETVYYKISDSDD